MARDPGVNPGEDAGGQRGGSRGRDEPERGTRERCEAKPRDPPGPHHERRGNGGQDHAPPRDRRPRQEHAAAVGEGAHERSSARREAQEAPPGLARRIPTIGIAPRRHPGAANRFPSSGNGRCGPARRSFASLPSDAPWIAAALHRGALLFEEPRDVPPVPEGQNAASETRANADERFCGRERRAAGGPGRESASATGTGDAIHDPSSPRDEEGRCRPLLPSSGPSARRSQRVRGQCAVHFTTLLVM